jgi:hypothetical protein
MKIECTIKRAGGSKVAMGEKVYHFKPENPDDAMSPHVAEISDPQHIDRLLGIKEAYARADGKAKATTIDPNLNAQSPAPTPAATPAPGPTGNEPADGLDGFAKADLVDLVKQENIDVDTQLPKPALVAKIREARAAKK